MLFVVFDELITVLVYWCGGFCVALWIGVLLRCLYLLYVLCFTESLVDWFNSMVRLYLLQFSVDYY